MPRGVAQQTNDGLGDHHSRESHVDRPAASFQCTRHVLCAGTKIFISHLAMRREANHDPLRCSSLLGLQVEQDGASVLSVFCMSKAEVLPMMPHQAAYIICR